MKKYLIFILLLAFILRLAYIDTSYIFWDESIYLMEGKFLVGEEVGFIEFDYRPPLLPLLISPFALFENYVLISKIFMILFNLVFIYLVYLLGKQFNPYIGLLSAFIVSILPFHIHQSSWVMTDGPAATLLLASLLFYFTGLKRKNNLIYFGGVFLSLSILMKFTSLLLVILLLPLFIYNIKQFKNIFNSLIISFFVFLPYLIFNYISFGNILYVPLRAFTIGNENIARIGLLSQKIIFGQFVDLFGIIVSILFVLGIILYVIKNRFKNGFFLYCLLVFIPYYIYIIHEGTTPLWWDTQRFMIMFIPFVLLYFSYFVYEFTRNKYGKYFLIVLLAVIMLSFSSQYERFSQPALEQENGLREATKEFGLYLKETEIDNLVCIGNCPPIAYYSDKKIFPVFSLEEFNLDEHGIIFSNKIEQLKIPYEEVKSTCKKDHCVYLIKSPRV